MSSTWYLKQSQRELGPLSLGQLLWLAQRGRLTASDSVRTDCSDQWARLRDVDELVGVWETARAFLEATQAERSQDRRWRRADDDVPVKRSERFARHLALPHPPPRSQVPEPVGGTARTRPRPDSNTHTRYRVARWRARQRANFSSIWGVICLILVGVLFGGGGAWMMSAILRGDDSPLPEDGATQLPSSRPHSPGSDATVPGGSPYQSVAALAQRLRQVASWNHAKQDGWEAAGRARVWRSLTPGLNDRRRPRANESLRRPNWSSRCNWQISTMARLDATTAGT